MQDEGNPENGEHDVEEITPFNGLRTILNDKSIDTQKLINQIRGIEIREMPEQKKRYAFWSTQPVRQFDEDKEEEEVPEGPIDEIKDPKDVRQEPYALPKEFEWSISNLENENERQEIFKLLSENYVEDDDLMFRFNYSREFLKWALLPPGYCKDWHLGVRVRSNSKLVAFISGVPASMRVRSATVPMVEINFLCIHKKLRSKRLAPVLIKEITRRVNLKNIWQAAYTAGVLLPRPVSTCQYWHRSLNPKKLIGIGFSRLAPRMTMARTVKLYKLPEKPQTPGIRPMKKEDVPEVTQKLNAWLDKYELAPVFTEEEVEHYLMPVPDVIDSYVVADPGTGAITDLVSYYTLPSTVLGNDKYDSLKAAFLYYTFSTREGGLTGLLNDGLIIAHSKEHDVFNALDHMQNETFLKELKFGIGDGKLRYYLYNWRVNKEFKPSEVGLVLL